MILVLYSYFCLVSLHVLDHSEHCIGSFVSLSTLLWLVFWQELLSFGLKVMYIMTDYSLALTTHLHHFSSYSATCICHCYSTISHTGTRTLCENKVLKMLQCHLNCVSATTRRCNRITTRQTGKLVYLLNVS